MTRSLGPARDRSARTPTASARDTWARDGQLPARGVGAGTLHRRAPHRGRETPRGVQPHCLSVPATDAASRRCDPRSSLDRESADVLASTSRSQRRAFLGDRCCGRRSRLLRDRPRWKEQQPTTCADDSEPLAFKHIPRCFGGVVRGLSPSWAGGRSFWGSLCGSTSTSTGSICTIARCGTRGRPTGRRTNGSTWRSWLRRS